MAECKIYIPTKKGMVYPGFVLNLNRGELIMSHVEKGDIRPVELKTGWAASPMGIDNSFHKDWIGIMPEQDEPKLLLQLNILLADGSRLCVVSDGTWQTTDGPTPDDSIWYGEKYDSRLKKPGWSTPGYDPAEWAPVKVMSAPAGRPKSSLMPPIKIVETVLPIEAMEPGEKTRVYDFGKVTAGWAKIRLTWIFL